MPNEIPNGVGQLKAAVRRRDIQKIRWLLTHLENSSALAGSLPHSCGVAGDESLVKLALEYTADADDHSMTPLLSAVLWENETAVNLLLDKGAQVNVTDGKRNTPLHYAVQWGSLRVIERLLERGADINAAGGYSWTPLQSAVIRKNEPVVNLLLDRGAQVNLSDESRNSPLHDAVMWGSVRVIERLLKHGAHIDAADNNSKTPLHLALSREKEIIVNLLLDRGAQVNVLDERRNSPLHYAAQWGSVPVVERLLERGADIHAANSYSQTPLGTAVCSKNETIVNLLLDRGAKVNELCGSPLYYAAKSGSVPIIERLLEFGADVNQVNRGDMTPLLAAAAFGKSGEAVIALLRHGADVKARCSDGKTALHYVAKWAEDETVVENLLYYGADPKARNKIGSTALCYSINNECSKVTRILLENCVSETCCFLTSKMDDRGGETEKILRLHFLDLKVRNTRQQVNKKVCRTCRLFLKEITRGDIDGEIAKMKERAIVKGITLYDLITKTKNQLVPFVRNTRLLSALASVDVARDFPVCVELFEYKWNAALSRWGLIQDGVCAFRSLMIGGVASHDSRAKWWGWIREFLMGSPETPTADYHKRPERFKSFLPDHVLEDIFSMLTDADLRNLMAASQLTN